MREIEFRGKRIDSGEWCRGGLSGTGSAFWIYAAGNAIPVSPESVGQYTGLKDRNGVKIFEGDILEWGHYKKICQVSWLEDTARFLYITVDRKLLYPGEASACAVIGNVHDNPELLEAS